VFGKLGEIADRKGENRNGISLADTGVEMRGGFLRERELGTAPHSDGVRRKSGKKASTRVENKKV